jgi:hypothetical protein
MRICDNPANLTDESHVEPFLFYDAAVTRRLRIGKDMVINLPMWLRLRNFLHTKEAGSMKMRMVPHHTGSPLWKFTQAIFLFPGTPFQMPHRRTTIGF